MENKKIRVAITHGDTNGIGYEIIFKAFSESNMFDLCTPIIYGSPRVAMFHRKALDMPVNFNTVYDASDVQDGKLNLVSCFDEEVKVEFGKPTQDSGRAAYIALERAVVDYKKGLFDVLVTGPVCKAAMSEVDSSFVGHTEFLNQRLGKPDDDILMILMNSKMRVALVTTHTPIRNVADSITEESVERKLRILYKSLRRDFLLSSPRIAVLSLNPHAGDNGLIGNEENTAIKPAIEKLAGEGIPCFGPYPADGFFGDADYKHFDAVLAMYHDQGLAPLKALGMDDGVNFTAGLSMVRTSPDHGTAYDIAGKNCASENSMRQAVYTAIDVWRNRRFDDIAKANPLRDEYHDRRDDSDKLRDMNDDNSREDK